MLGCLAEPSCQSLLPATGFKLDKWSESQGIHVDGAYEQKQGSNCEPCPTYILERFEANLVEFASFCLHANLCL